MSNIKRNVLAGLIQVLLETKEFIDILLKLCLSGIECHNYLGMLFVLDFNCDRLSFHVIACNETLLRGFRRVRWIDLIDRVHREE